jgi:hypothetical protein
VALIVPTTVPLGLVLEMLKTASLTTGGRLGGLVRLTTIAPFPVALPSFAVTVKLKLLFVPKSPGSVTVITPELLMAKGRVPSLSVSVLPLVIVTVKGLFSGSLMGTVPTVAPTAILLAMVKVLLVITGG